MKLSPKPQSMLLKVNIKWTILCKLHLTFHSIIILLIGLHESVLTHICGCCNCHYILSEKSVIIFILWFYDQCTVSTYIFGGILSYLEYVPMHAYVANTWHKWNIILIKINDAIVCEFGLYNF